MKSTPRLTEIRQSVYQCVPVGRRETPELEGVEGQLLELFTIVIRKIMKAGGKEESYVEQVVRQMYERCERGFADGDRHRIYAVVGQKEE